MPDEPAIKITETDPSEKPLERAANEPSARLKFRFYEKGARATVIERLKASRIIPLQDQEYILARIALIPEVHEVIQVSVVGNPHKDGFNFTFTVCEL